MPMARRPTMSTVNGSIAPNSTPPSAVATLPLNTLPPSPPPRTSNSHGSSIDLAGSHYAERSRRLIELTNDLKALGANHLLDIPRVVFIGNQSAGKSSVVEGVTGTKVPRDSGTCTRCPMECTMEKTTGAWHCSIKLRLEFDNDGGERMNPLTIPFAELTTPGDVELALKRAQAAILCDVGPGSGTLDEAIVAPFRTKSAAEIRTMQDTPGHLMSFSFNTVEMYVRDPQGTHLSFVDLPGIIQHHAADPTMVPLVTKLVKRAIVGVNTLIVLTIPMTDDVENQQAFVFAKEADPRGVRTIGVGTKPDLLQPGSTGLISNWKEIFQGNAHQLQHGYYCVKLPDDATRAAGHSRAQLQRLEAEFFQAREPWRGFSDRSRFGIRNFVKSTSRLLISLIESNLPVLKDEVDQLLTKDVAEYDKLPALVNQDQPLHVVLARISSFCRAFQRTIGGELNKDFVHGNRRLYEKLRREVVATEPIFATGLPVCNVVTINHFSSAPIHPPAPNAVKKKITVDDVRAAIDNNLTWELPNYVPFEATKGFILSHVCQWKEPAQACFASVCSNLTTLVDQLLDEPDHFGRFKELSTLVRTVVSTEEEACALETGVMLNKLFNLENSVPFYTQNSSAYEAERQAWNAKYNVNVQHGQAADVFKVMADVHAYFQVASKRFIDQVPLSIEGELHQALAARLETKLFQVVVAMDSDNLAEMLREDPEVRARRERLRVRVERLRAIKLRLQEYERGARMPHLEPEVL